MKNASNGTKYRRNRTELDGRKRIAEHDFAFGEEWTRQIKSDDVMKR